MIFHEETVRSKISELRKALDNRDGTGISDDAAGASDETLRRLAIEQLNREADMQVDRDLARVTKELEVVTEEQKVIGIPCVSEEMPKMIH